MKSYSIISHRLWILGFAEEWSVFKDSNEHDVNEEEEPSIEGGFLDDGILIWDPLRKNGINKLI